MKPRTVIPAAVSALLVLVAPPVLGAHVPTVVFAGRTADIPTTTVANDDFLALFPMRDDTQNSFVAGEGSDGDSPDGGSPDGESVDLPGTGTSRISWGSAALAVAAAGAIITASARSRRQRRPRGGARSGPAA